MTPSSLRRRYCTAVLVAKIPVPPSRRALESINNSKHYNPQCDINHFIHEKNGLALRCSTGDQENEERRVSLNLVTLTFAIFYLFFSRDFTVLVIWNAIFRRLMLVRNGLVTRGDAVEMMHVGVDLVWGHVCREQERKTSGLEVSWEHFSSLRQQMPNAKNAA